MRHVCPECGEAGGEGRCPRDHVARVPAGTDALLGTTIGSWRIARLIGAGGMGRVYLGVQPAIGGRVAIKVLKREAAADDALVERFFNEARAVNLIRHERIIDVIDLGRLPDGAPYIVMEHLDGASLAALIRRRGKLPLGTLARMVADVLDALAATHAKGIVHRDLKPDNVFVSPSGQITVLDLGIAKLATADGLTTQTGSLLGTPAYMAPEQARSQPVDARADLYAAGVILFEGATGTLPFASASLYELLDLHVKAPPPRPRERNAAIPAALEDIILRALAKEPSERFASASEMRDALLAATEGLPADELASITIAPPSSAATPSDPLAPTAATQASQASSLAHGETMPSSPPANAPSPAANHVQLRRGTVIALGAVAVLGAGTALVLALRGGRDGEATRSPPVVTVIDAAVEVVAHADAAVLIAVTDAAVADPPTAVAVADASAPSVDAPARTEVASAPRPRPLAGPTFEDVQAGAVYLPLPKPRAFDPHAYYATALAHARRIGGKVYPTVITWRGVSRAGLIDTTTAGTVAEYTFFSAENGEKPGKYCYVFVAAEAGKLRVGVGTPSDGTCTTPRGVAPPRCPIAELWRRAAASDEGDKDVLAASELVVINRLSRRWQFTSMRDPQKFSVSLVDDCP